MPCRTTWVSVVSRAGFRRFQRNKSKVGPMETRSRQPGPDAVIRGTGRSRRRDLVVIERLRGHSGHAVCCAWVRLMRNLDQGYGAYSRRRRRLSPGLGQFAPDRLLGETLQGRSQGQRQGFRFRGRGRRKALLNACGCTRDGGGKRRNRCYDKRPQMHDRLSRQLDGAMRP
jgi:hypothetical protein